MNIIPKPRKYVKLGGEFTVTAQTKVYAAQPYEKQAQRFVDAVEQSCGFSLQFVQDMSLAQVLFTYTDQCDSEEYFVMISDGLVTVSAYDEKGCFYAVETLRQLFRLDTTQQTATYNDCYIYDAPKFVYRGLSVDICRHFFPLETLKRIVQLMSRVKLNKLHLHLSDDQGFRVEIKKYPLLNSVSSRRIGSEVLENGERFVDDKEVSGYLTRQDVEELVQFAQEHQVEVIPEIDLPGHSVAMIAAYPYLGCTGEQLEVRKKWGISKDILCAGNDSVYTFIKDVLDEICQMFPSQYIHLGGDEAPKDRWCNCEKCRARLTELKLDDYDQLQTYMVEQFRRYLQEKGRKVICWNDGVNKATSEEIISQVWKPLTRRSGVKQANKGRKVIMSPTLSMYFDYPYCVTPLYKTFKFKPLRGVKRDRTENVLGVEGTVWTEWIASEDKLFFNLLPRLLALAECAWGNNTGDFRKRAEMYLPLYDKMGLTYNKKATSVKHRNLHLLKKFLKINPNVELDLQNKNNNGE